MNNQESDQELIERFYRNDDDSALETFVTRHRQWALRKASQYSLEEAEDIVQVSILRLMDSQPVDGVVASPLGWWNTIIGAVAVDQIRKVTAWRKKENLCSGSINSHENPPSVEDTTIRSQLIQLIREEIGNLDDRFKEALLKRYFDDLSYSEMSNILRVSPGTVASRLARAIAHVREALDQRGMSDLMYRIETQGDTKTMTNKSPEILDGNKRFVEKWNETWSISDGVGLSRFKTQLNDDGSAEVNWRLDFPFSTTPYNTENPESATDRLWFESTLILEDVLSFKWTHYRSKEGATGSAYSKMLDRGMLYDADQTLEFLGDNRLAVKSNGDQTATLSIPGSDPVVPDILLALLVCEAEPARETVFPINLLCFERNSNGRRWGIAPTRGAYSGRKGLPTGLSHTFEVEMQQYTGRDLSFWVDDERKLIGFGDERESHVVAGDEPTARSLLSHKSPEAAPS